MRIQPTKIEQLNREFPGLCDAVDSLLKAGGDFKEYQALVKERTGQVVASSTLSNYKQKRFLKEEQLLKITKRGILAASQLASENKMTDTRRAQLFEISNLVLREFAEANPRYTGTLELGWARQSLREKQYELQRKRDKREIRELKLKEKWREKELKESTDEGETKIRSGKAFTLEDINNIRQRSLGLPPIPPTAGPAT
jgi:hypothetical protein